MSINENDINEIREQLARHEERFVYMQGRFDENDRAHKDVREIVEKIRQKIFNGYDTTIKSTQTDVNKIYEIVQDLQKTHLQHSSGYHMDKESVREIVKSALHEYAVEHPSMDKDGVKDIVASSISSYDSDAMREQREEHKWWKHHKLEVLAAVGVIGGLASAVVAILAAFGAI